MLGESWCCSYRFTVGFCLWVHAYSVYSVSHQEPSRFRGPYREELRSAVVTLYVRISHFVCYILTFYFLILMITNEGYFDNTFSQSFRTASSVIAAESSAACCRIKWLRDAVERTSRFLEARRAGQLARSVVQAAARTAFCECRKRATRGTGPPHLAASSFVWFEQV